MFVFLDVCVLYPNSAKSDPRKAKAIFNRTKRLMRRRKIQNTDTQTIWWFLIYRLRNDTVYFHILLMFLSLFKIRNIITVTYHLYNLIISWFPKCVKFLHNKIIFCKTYYTFRKVPYCSKDISSRKVWKGKAPRTTQPPVPQGFHLRPTAVPWKSLIPPRAHRMR